MDDVIKVLLYLAKGMVEDDNGYSVKAVEWLEANIPDGYSTELKSYDVNGALRRIEHTSNDRTWRNFSPDTFTYVTSEENPFKELIITKDNEKDRADKI